MHSRTRTLPIALLLALSAACINENEKASALHEQGSPDTDTYDAEVAKQWMDLLFASIDAENLNPPEASRRIGYAGVTLYESVVPGQLELASLGEQLNGLGRLPRKPSGLIHWPSVANAALPVVLTELFAGASASTLQGFVDLEAALATQFAVDVPDQDTRDRSIDYGQDIAEDILDWVAGDGYALFNDCAFTPPVGDGLWIPTPPAFVPNPLEPCWGNLRPFALLFAAECAPLSFPTFSKTAGSAFAAEAQEVYDLNDSFNTADNLTPEQMDIALFWADGGGTLTPPGHWVSILGQVVDQEGLNLAEAAEAYARLGIAVADAFISCWEIKYAYNLLRPVSYIQDATGPIADPTWTSFIGTPPFPEFDSGHSTQSGAVAFLLEDLLGEVEFEDHTHDGVPLAPRSFDSFTEAADEAAISRLYGGIHYRSAIERGLEHGRCIGQVILQNVKFHKPVD